jgi:AIG2-like family
MPLYFAYGSNMNTSAMRRRCPYSKPLGRACLARHRLFIMSSGYASVRRDPRMNVHGVLFDLALCDVPALDRYEELGRGLYTKLTQMVLRADSAPVRALVYVGRDQSIGIPSPDYMAEVIAAAREWNLPEAYVAYLGTCAGAGGTGGHGYTTRAKVL